MTQTVKPALKQIFWVDDEESIREVIAKFAQINGPKDGFVITLAANATEGLILYHEAKAEGKPFDLLVLDIAMPDHSGLWLAKEIREGGDWQSKILFCTAHDVVLNRHEAQDVGAIGYLTKPIDFKTLPETLGAALAE